MLVKVTTLLKNLKGDAPLLAEDTKEEIPLRPLLLNVLITTLTVPSPSGPQPEVLDGETKVRMFMLAQRIARHTTVDLTAEDISLLKERIARAHTPLIVARVWEMLDPASVNGKPRDSARPPTRRKRTATKKKKK